MEFKAHCHCHFPSLQYFLKVVPTEYRPLSGPYLKTHQYSVTSYERDLAPAVNAGNAANPAQEAHHTTHGYAGVPGVFFNYEIGALKAITTEARQSIMHFLTSTCAIVGGILTLAGLLDGVIYNGRKRLGKGHGDDDDGHHSGGLGYASASGKFM